MPAEPTMHPDSQAGLRPVPDPTLLTTQQLYREISIVRESVDESVASVKSVLETRLSAMDHANDLLQASTDKIPSQIDERIGQLREVTSEKFKSIATQFTERDIRTEQTARDSKVAVDAALQAAKEAVGEQNKSNALAIAKSEATFTKQIDQIGVLISTMQKGIDDKIDDIKTRLQAIESHKLGVVDQKGITNTSLGFLITGFGVFMVAVQILLKMTFH
jgi:uncharacterized membrane protein YfhO